MRATVCMVAKRIMWGPCSPAPVGQQSMENSEAGSWLCVFDSCHPECLLLQECQEMHGEVMGSACGQHGPYTPDVLFWSCILFFATFIVSSTLKTFKTSRYFPTRVGSMLVLLLFGSAGCQNPPSAPCCQGQQAFPAPGSVFHSSMVWKEEALKLCDSKGPGKLRCWKVL